MEPDISVVVPVLNEIKHLDKCLQNLTHQSLDSALYEIIVVDNGSTDRSFQAALDHGGVRVLREEARDPYLARNTGVRAARGRVIAFTDAHCTADHGWLLQVWRAFFEGAADLAVGPLGYSNSASRLLRLYGAHHQSKLAYIFSEHPDGGTFCHGANLAVRKSLFEDLGGFHPLPIPGDTELVNRLKRQLPTAAVLYLPDAMVRRQTVRTLRQLLLKTTKHARYNRELISGGTFRTLSWKDRARVFSDCQKQRGLSWLDSILLVYVLAVGVLVFEAAQLRARWFGS